MRSALPPILRMQLGPKKDFGDVFSPPRSWRILHRHWLGCRLEPLRTNQIEPACSTRFCANMMPNRLIQVEETIKQLLVMEECNSMAHLCNSQALVP